MEKLRNLTAALKILLMISIFSFSPLVWADDPTSAPETSSAADQVAANPAPSNPAATSSHKSYKGEMEANNHAVVPQSMPKYAGQVYLSDSFPSMPEDKIPELPSGTPLHDGFYIGGLFGFDSYQMLTKVNINVLGVSSISQNPQLNAQGMTYTLVGGYGRVFDDPLYMGAEIFYNYSRADTSQNISASILGVGDTYSIKTLVQGSYGINLIPGFKMGRSTLLYLKTGYSQIETKTYETLAALGINTSRSTGVSGINLGLGFEVAVYMNMSLRAEYTHIYAKSFTTPTGTKITPSDNQFMVGLNLHFV